MGKNMKLILAALFLFLVQISIPAQNGFAEKIDENIKAEMENQQIPGVSVAVIKDGKPLYLKGYGLANVEHQVAVKPETIFQSGSIGKQFTAAAIMILAQENKLRLDDKITKYFPDAPESWKDITVRHLLTHTSGMSEYPDDFDYRKDYTEDDFLKMIKATPLRFKTGERWEYSNLGYLTLGILIGKISGKHHGEFLRERVFAPLEMTTARVISEADIIPNRASGYRLEKGELKNQRWVSPSINSTADGALYLSAIDIAKWEAGLNSEKILKKASLEQMWTSAKLNDDKGTHYGLGWEIQQIGDQKLIFHGGAWQGFKSYILRFPKDKLTIAVFANLAQANPNLLVRAVASVFYPEFALGVKPVKDTNDVLTRATVRTLFQISEGNAKNDSFTTEAQKDFLPNKSKNIAENLNKFGLPIAAIHEMQLIGRDEKNGFTVSRYSLVELTKSMIVEVKTAGDGKIADVKIVEMKEISNIK